MTASRPAQPANHVDEQAADRSRMSTTVGGNSARQSDSELPLFE